MGVIKVKPWGKDQGDHVLIEESDFNPDFHQHFDVDPVGGDKKMTVDEMRAALKELGVEVPEGAKKAEIKALLDKATEPKE